MCYNYRCSRKKDRYGEVSVNSTLSRKVQTDVRSGMERKLQLVIACVSLFYPYVTKRTDPELTGFESNRDEWV